MTADLCLVAAVLRLIARHYGQPLWSLKRLPHDPKLFPHIRSRLPDMRKRLFKVSKRFPDMRQ
jgi:hypothetical protein